MTGRTLTVPDPWAHLKAYTQARIALGRAGSSLPTDEVLRFACAHARARDAVHASLDAPALEGALQAAGFASLRVRSAAPDRATYLLRPDLGRRLDAADAARLRAAATAAWDVLPVVGDGLSALAVARHALPLLELLRGLLAARWRLGSVVVATQARVALADEIGATLGARLCMLLIGERPGLSSPDSLGVYVTYGPRPGRRDAERNCVSNIRPEGLGYGEAARRVAWLVEEAMRRGLTGVGLEGEGALPAPAG